MTDEEVGEEMSRLQTIQDIEGGRSFKADVEKESVQEDVQEQVSEFEPINELVPEDQKGNIGAEEAIEVTPEVVEEVTPVEQKVEGETEDVVQEAPQANDFNSKSQMLFDMHRDGKLNDEQLQERLDNLASQSWDQSPSDLMSDQAKQNEQEKLKQQQDREVAESFSEKGDSDAVTAEFKKVLKRSDEKEKAKDREEEVVESFYDTETDAPTTLTERQTNVVVRSLKNSFKSLKDVEVVKDQETANKLIGRESKPMEGFVKGGKIYLVAENLRGKNTTEAVNRAVEVFYHEGIGHQGLTAFLNKNGGFDNFLEAFGKNTRNKAKIRKWLATKRGQNYKDKDSKVQIEEYIASEFAEKGVRGVGTLESVGEAIRRVMGIKGSETALRQALQKVQRQLQDDKSSTLFSGVGRSGKLTEDEPETTTDSGFVGTSLGLEKLNESTDEAVRASYLLRNKVRYFQLLKKQKLFSLQKKLRPWEELKSLGRKG